MAVKRDSNGECPLGFVYIPPKDPRTKGRYNVLSRLLFCWLEPLFCIGARRTLKHSDLYAHPREADSGKLLKFFNIYWSHEITERKSSPRLWWVLVQCIGWLRFLRQIFLGFSQVVLLLFLLHYDWRVILFTLQSVVLGKLVDYFSIESPSSTDTRNAYLYASALVLVTAVLVPNSAHFFHTSRVMDMIISRSLLAAIYQKVLILSQMAVGKLTVGHVVNLASIDVYRFEYFMYYFQYFWFGPLLLILSTYVMYIEIQWAAFVAATVILLQIPLQLYLSKIYKKMRLRITHATDERVKVMNEVISGIRVIKLYGWEYAFQNLVANIRKKEVSILLQSAVILSIRYAVFVFSIPLYMFIIFSSYTAFGGELTPRKLFVTLSLIVNLRLVCHFVVLCLFGLSDSAVSIKRIKDFLLLHDSNMVICTETKVREPEVIVKSLSTSWNHNTLNDQLVEDTVTDKLVLKNISFEVTKDNPLLAVVGPVGSGKAQENYKQTREIGKKSTLLQCLLRELLPLSGEVTVKGIVAYASQEAWIFSSTLRENILFGKPFQPQWYSRVIEACALDIDIENLPDGDLSIVGERGITLSGGQKARVNLARAIYSKADIYLLDDPLSAVDAAVSRHIFDRCIKGLLSNKCVVLVTHQLQYVEQCDRILVLKEGRVEKYGFTVELDEAEYHSEIEMNEANEFIAWSDDDSNLSVMMEDNNINTTASHHSDIISMISVPSTDLQIITTNETVPSGMNTSGSLVAEERGHGRISLKTFFEYFKAGGGYVFTSFVLILLVISEGSVLVSDWWISDWSECSVQINSTETTCGLNIVSRISTYFGLTLMVIVLSFIRCTLLFVLLLRASRVLHNRMFKAVLRAPVHFFDTNPIGRILNRFSQDISFMDVQLSMTYSEFVIYLARFVAAVIVAVVANPYMIIVITILVVVLLIFRSVCFRTIRDIKRLEALARSPLYSHISATLQGLPTIRSYSMESTALDQFHTYCNQHSQAWYLFIVSTRWLHIRGEIIAIILVLTTSFLSIPLSESLNASLIGLSLAYSIGLAIVFESCLYFSIEVEAIMVSTERVLSYSKLEPEASLESTPSTFPPPDWPKHGHIEMNDVCYRHSSDGQLVLKGISLNIHPGEKIGIVGRTGAGKSSLIAALFRLAEPQGSIQIDGVNCLQLGLHDLRKNISIIPQDPVLFSSTVRYNLDPFNESNDIDIWNALQKVQLKSVVECIDGQLGGIVSEGGSNFSVGQRQLFCLARALLRNNKILVLDEATANVDLKTDSLIKVVIREQFVDCTVFTIAHRLDTVMESDRILVLRSGEVCEIDKPYELLCKPTSYLLRLVEHTGPVASQKLLDMALKSHLTKTITKS